MPRRKKRKPQGYYDVVLSPKPKPDNLEDYQTWPKACVEIELPLLPYLLGVMDMYLYGNRITGTEDEQALFLSLWRNLQARIASAVGGCADMSFQLRQSAVNPCVLEQTLNGGLTWSLAFDYSKCKSRNLNLEIETETNITNIFNDYSTYTTNNEYHPSAPAESGTYTDGANSNEQEWRRRALCYASGSFIDIFYETIKQIVEERTNRAALVTAVIGAIGAVAALFTGGTSLALAAGIASAILGVSTALYENLSMETINDATGRDQLKCCFYNQFKTKPATLSAWGFSKTGCTLNTNATAMATILETVIVEANYKDEMFGAFLTALGEGYSLAQAGVLPACNCDNDTFTRTFNFRDSQHGWIKSNNYDQIGGSWVAGVGLVSGSNGVLTFYRPSASPFTVTKIIVNVTVTGSPFSQNNWCATTTNAANSPTFAWLDGSDLSVNLNLGNGANQTVQATGSKDNQVKVYVYLSFANAEFQIHSVTVEGLGSDPF